MPFKVHVRFPLISYHCCSRGYVLLDDGEKSCFTPGVEGADFEETLVAVSLHATKDPGTTNYPSSLILSFAKFGLVNLDDPARSSYLRCCCYLFCHPFSDFVEEGSYSRNRESDSCGGFRNGRSSRELVQKIDELSVGKLPSAEDTVRPHADSFVAALPADSIGVLSWRARDYHHPLDAVGTAFLSRKDGDD